MSCGVGDRRVLDLALLWLWHRLAAVTLVQPLAWEPPYAAGVTLKGHNKKKRIENLSSLNLPKKCKCLHIQPNSIRK